MRRYLRFALLLAIANLLAQTLFVALFRHVDLRFPSVFELILIPALQAVVLVWLAPDQSPVSAYAVLREMAANRFLFPVAALDLALLAYSSVKHVEWLRAVHGFAAAALVVAVATQLRRIPKDFRWMLLFAAGIALFALSSVWNWIAFLPAVLGRGHTVLRWLAAYIPLYVAAILALLHTVRVLEQRSRTAALLLDSAVAAALVAAVIVAGNIYFRPYLIEPWRSIESALSWLVVTAIVLASVCALLCSGDADANP